MIQEGDVIQFNETHKWTGILGIVGEIKQERIMVGVPIPQKGTAYIHCKKKKTSKELVKRSLSLNNTPFPRRRFNAKIKKKGKVSPFRSAGRKEGL